MTPIIHFKNKDVFEKLIYNTLKQNYGYDEEIILIERKTKYKKCLQNYTILYDDVIKIIDDYTVDEIKINIASYIRIKVLIIEVKCYGLFDFVITYNHDDTCAIFTPHIKPNIINRVRNYIVLDMIQKKINIKDYDKKFRTELNECMSNYIQNNNEFVNQSDSIIVNSHMCNYINFFNEFMKRNYNKNNYIACWTTTSEDGYYIKNNNYVIYNHESEDYNIGTHSFYNMLYYELIKPLDHKKLKKIIVIMKLLIDVVKNQINIYRKN